jgi:hypothetical protein
MEVFMKYFLIIFVVLVLFHNTFAQKYHFFGTLDIDPMINREYEIIENPTNPSFPIQIISKEDNLGNLLNYGIEFRYSVLNNLPILIGLRLNYGPKNLYDDQTSGQSFKEKLRIFKASVPIIYQIDLAQRFKFNLILSLGSASIRIETLLLQYGIQYNPDGTQTQIIRKLLDEKYTENRFYYSPSFEFQIKITKNVSILSSIKYESFSIQTGSIRGKYKIEGIGFRLSAGYSL